MIRKPHTIYATAFAAMLMCLGLISSPTMAQSSEGSDNVARILSSVVGIRATIDPAARTAESLGTTREGSGVLIGHDGLIVTIGYLILEATKVEVIDAGGTWVGADIVAYDHNTGFGLVRAVGSLDSLPIDLGNSEGLKRDDAVMVVSRVGGQPTMGALVADRREFAGYWEYLLDDAIFTVPPHRQFGGAALIDRHGRLVGVGSLIVGDAVIADSPVPGNMFIPIDALKPIKDELIAKGRTGAPRRPWLGIYSEDLGGRVMVTRVARGGPADQAGIKRGDIIVGVDGRRVASMADFYRKIWAVGGPGDTVPMDMVPFGSTELTIKRVSVISRDRYDWLRLRAAE